MDKSEADIREFYLKLKKETEEGGYFLNPDLEFTMDLIKGLIVNQNRYGYPNCPCRLSEGSKEADLDIICPCDYRDADILEHGACYCALYVSRDIAEGRKKAKSIPERRPRKEIRMQASNQSQGNLKEGANLPYPVWRCNVCGYLCARENPPEICPICKAKKERFARFL